MDEISLPYRRTQIGALMLLVLVPPTLWVASLAARTQWHPVAIFGLIVLLMALSALHALTVHVDREEVTVRFGFVPYAKRLPVEEIVSARQVRNEVRQLWGARPIEGGWLFSVSGLDAVELTMKDETIYRIGTDRPQELLGAVQAAIGSR